MKKLIMALALVMSGATFAANFNCSAEMKGFRGGIIQSFYGTSWWSHQSACSDAMDKCTRDLQYRQARGMNPYARCSIRGGHIGRPNPGYPGYPGGQMVVKHCSVDRVGRHGRGRLFQTHMASATGYRGTGVKQQACRRAMRQCQMSAVRAQICIKRY